MLVLVKLKPETSKERKCIKCSNPQIKLNSELFVDWGRKKTTHWSSWNGRMSPQISEADFVKKQTWRCSSCSECSRPGQASPKMDSRCWLRCWRGQSEETVGNYLRTRGGVRRLGLRDEEEVMKGALSLEQLTAAWSWNMLRHAGVQLAAWLSYVRSSSRRKSHLVTENDCWSFSEDACGHSFYMLINRSSWKLHLPAALTSFREIRFYIYSSAGRKAARPSKLWLTSKAHYLLVLQVINTQNQSSFISADIPSTTSHSWKTVMVLPSLS